MNGEIITMYVPIFREKLARLEDQGRGTTDEAIRLRRAISWVESARNPKGKSLTPDVKVAA